MDVRRELTVNGQTYTYFSLAAAVEAGFPNVDRLPFSWKVILENLLRQHGRGLADEESLPSFRHACLTHAAAGEVRFRFSRVLLPDSSGVPMLGDLAAMRDAIARLGGDPAWLDPQVRVDVVVDHSVMVDEFGAAEAAARNLALELERNTERYDFLRWASQAFHHLHMMPFGSGICHQINLERLARVVWTEPTKEGLLAYPDSVLGMDSHTPMINALGVLGWGVGGLEGCAGVLGEAMSILIPAVVGCRLSGTPRPGVTATDLVLNITKELRRHRLVGKFVEYFGPGLNSLSLADRATIANMTPENGSTVGFFPVDAETVRYLKLTGRDPAQAALVEAYCRAQGLWRDADTPPPHFHEVIEIDLGLIQPSVSGPKRPQDAVPLGQASKAFREFFAARPGQRDRLKDGDIVIAAITSCTNTSNPVSMISAGLLARNAAARGLRPKPWVKTSLSPGSQVVADYLTKSGLQRSLDALGFHVAGFGCMTCMGNSGPLPQAISDAIETDHLDTVAVLSGNRNFEGRIHPAIKANFLASPPLVVAYAIAGSMLTNLEVDPLGKDAEGRPVLLSDIWPGDDEVRAVVDATLTPEVYRDRYEALLGGARPSAPTMPVPPTFPWKEGSTFIRRPPFLDETERVRPPLEDVRSARVLAIFDDMTTTDHISPIGAISLGTPAAEYLKAQGVRPRDFVNYAARRLNHDVMIRGTFANVRIRNGMTPGVEGTSTLHMPDRAPMSIHAAAMLYRQEGVPLIVIGGKDYGAGSSRDWAAKGTRMLGVRAVLAESFERIHCSNLIGMGVLPLTFPNGMTRQTLGLDGSELVDIVGIRDIVLPRSELECVFTRADGLRETFAARSRLDTTLDVEHFQHGGFLPWMVRECFRRGGQVQ